MTEIDQFVKEQHLDRAAYLRDVLRKGFSLDKQDHLFEECNRGELSMMEVCRKMKCNPWEFLSALQAKGLYLNVKLEDWLDTKDVTS